MRTLESDQNHKFKAWKRLKSSRGRKKEDAFLVESQKLVAEALFSSLEAESLIFRKSDALSAQEKLADQLKKKNIVGSKCFGSAFSPRLRSSGFSF